MKPTVYFDIHNHFAPWFLLVILTIIASAFLFSAFASKRNEARVLGIGAAMIVALIVAGNLNTMIPEYICYRNVYNQKTYETVEGTITEMPIEYEALQAPFLIGDVHFKVAPGKEMTAGFNKPDILRGLSDTNTRVKVYYTSQCPYPGANPILRIEADN